MKDRKKGIGLNHALNGLKLVFIREKNFKIHLLALLIVIAFGFYFTLTYIEWAIILLISSLVLVSEILNSVLELTIDYIKPDIHPTAKKIKDMSAGAVLLAALFAVIIGIIIFLPKLISLI